MVAILITLHWLACFFGLQGLLMVNSRPEGLEAAIAARVEVDPDCVGCMMDSADDSLSGMCSQPCMSTCEIEVAARMLGRSTDFVKKQESWLCRCAVVMHAMTSARLHGRRLPCLSAARCISSQPLQHGNRMHGMCARRTPTLIGTPAGMRSSA